MRPITLLIAPVLLAGLVADARADSDGYRGEVLAVDVATTAVFAGVTMRDHSSDGSFVAATALLVFAAPLDHALHDHWDRAGASLGAHVGFPVLGGLLGAAVATEDEGWDGLGKIAVGVLVGHVAAIVTDVMMAHADDDPTAPRMLSFGGHF